MNLSSLFESLTERIVVAFVAAVASALTLLLFPIALLILGQGSGGMEIGVVIYSFVFSGFSLFVIIGAAIVGFFVGAERMAKIFSFFWGTHSFWDKVGKFLDDKLSVLQTEHNAPTWLLVILLVALASFLVLNYA